MFVPVEPVLSKKEQSAINPPLEAPAPVAPVGTWNRKTPVSLGECTTMRRIADACDVAHVISIGPPLHASTVGCVRKFSAPRQNVLSAPGKMLSAPSGQRTFCKNVSVG